MVGGAQCHHTPCIVRTVVILSFRQVGSDLKLS